MSNTSERQSTEPCAKCGGDVTVYWTKMTQRAADGTVHVYEVGFDLARHEFNNP